MPERRAEDVVLPPPPEDLLPAKERSRGPRESTAPLVPAGQGAPPPAGRKS